MMIKAVLFDMDGVLYDSMPFHISAWSEVSRKHNLIHNPDDFYLYEGRTGGSTLDILFNNTFGRDATEEEKRDIYEEKVILFNNTNDGKVMDGAALVLSEAKACGLDTLLVTGSGQHTLIDKLNKDFPGCFRPEKMVTAFDVKYGKPHPEPYLMGLEKAGVSAREAIVIENAPLGVRSAVAAGIFTIAVNTGPLDDRVLLDEGAHMLFSNMHALAQNFISSINAASAAGTDTVSDNV
ncbi:MAG: HAD-IA family hydrolase [Tannerellaceae bacterium]|jgi:HAD superfamily hydrolase (TIGR01509 family)|nr:HAD-IA family hydrolase [Tannerellaceae bacterium]